MRTINRIMVCCVFLQGLWGCSSPPASGSDSGTPDGDGGLADADSLPETDWTISLSTDQTGEPLSTALLGHYDLSGALFSYDQVAELKTAMTEAGFSEWRVGIGRWEASTLLLHSLTDGTVCPFPIAAAFADHWLGIDHPGDLDLIASRDWFTDDGLPVDLADVEDDSRYQLDYVRSVLDVVDAFGVEPFLDIDLMPRSLAANRTPERSEANAANACSWSFTNAVSNTRPADPQVFSQAVAGLVRRLIEGSHGQPGRDVVYWELWNEPEFCYFWDPLVDNDTPCSQESIQQRLPALFDWLIPTLQKLTDYRQATPAASHLRFGFGSFAHAAVAAAIITQLDPSGLKPDFISFHAYDNDPLHIVAGVREVAEAARNSANLNQVELALTEWGPELDQAPDPALMDQALHAATVLALGAAAGLDRAHRAIFWDYYTVIPFGLLDHDGQPKPLFRAYQLLAEVIRPESVRLSPAGLENGELDGGQGAVLASRDAQGTHRLLLVNRNDGPRTASIRLDGKALTPRRTGTFSDPAGDIVWQDSPAPVIDVPARSLVLAVVFGTNP